MEELEGQRFIAPASFPVTGDRWLAVQPQMRYCGVLCVQAAHILDV